MGIVKQRGQKIWPWSVDLAQCQSKKDKAFVLERGSLPRLPITPLVSHSCTQPLICSCHPSPTDIHSYTLSLVHILYYRVIFSSISTGSIMHNTTCECLRLTRYLFFADLGNSGPGNDPRIERTYMDGSNRFDLKLSKILNPRGLTVDPVNQRLFWVDSHLDHLETVDYYGLNRYFWLICWFCAYPY